MALTLRLLGGLTTAEIAHAFVDSEATVAGRITRAKRKLAVSGVEFETPADDELEARLPSVRGDLLEKLGRSDEARAEFERAAAMTRNEREREVLLSRATGTTTG